MGQGTDCSAHIAASSGYQEDGNAPCFRARVTVDGWRSSRRAIFARPRSSAILSAGVRGLISLIVQRIAQTQTAVNNESARVCRR